MLSKNKIWLSCNSVALSFNSILLGQSRDGIIFSTDEYFRQNNGCWSYNVGQLGAAHDWNQKRGVNILIMYNFVNDILKSMDLLMQEFVVEDPPTCAVGSLFQYTKWIHLFSQDWTNEPVVVRCNKGNNSSPLVVLGHVKV